MNISVTSVAKFASTSLMYPLTLSLGVRPRMNGGVSPQVAMEAPDG